MAILECKDLTKYYDRALGLDHLSLRLEPGRIVGLLGPNGSGKTTLLKIANGLLTPSSGQLLIDGKAPGPDTRRLVSYLPERTYLSDWMTVVQLLDFFCDFYPDFDREAAEHMLTALEISPTQRIKQMSKGTREKVQLILVMSRRTRLYLLDEPIGGVDPATRDYIIHTILTNFNPDSTLLISTHLIADVERILDDVVFISRGQLVLHQSVDQIRQERGCSVDDLFRRCSVMLSKLLKYELRASGRILLPVYALLLASAGCCSLFYKLAADHPYRTGAASVLMGLLMMAFWIFVVATGAITALLMIYRFYKNYMTDEGYLMFTLPVNRHQLIWAKLLSALLYTAASAVAVTLSILLVLLPIADWSGFWGDLGELLSSITESLHFGVPGPLLLLWIAVLAILTVFSGFLMVYAAIALGHSFSNHKILLSVVFFIAFSLAMQAAGLSSFAFQLTVGEQIIETSGSAASLLDGTRFLVIDSIETLVACGVFYTLTWYNLQKRLNLQ